MKGERVGLSRDAQVSWASPLMFGMVVSGGAVEEPDQRGDKNELDGDTGQAGDDGGGNIGQWLDPKTQKKLHEGNGEGHDEAAEDHGSNESDIDTAFFALVEITGSETVGGQFDHHEEKDGELGHSGKAGAYKGRQDTHGGTKGCAEKEARQEHRNVHGQEDGAGPAKQVENLREDHAKG